MSAAVPRVRRARRLATRLARVVDGTLSLLTDPFGKYHMGVTAEKVAERHRISREQQDAFALLSQERAAQAVAEGRFAEQIVPVEAPRASEPFVTDEHPRETSLELLAGLKPVFQKDGSVTAGNSSGINDGAAAVLLMRLSQARERGLAPRLILRSWAVTGIEPEVMGYAPAMSIPKALELAGKTIGDLDAIELNEAFAAQAVAVRRRSLPSEKLNPCGGAIALGHPVGATGAILTVKLMHELERTDAHWGLVSMCIGGGQGFAAVFERP